MQPHNPYEPTQAALDGAMAPVVVDTSAELKYAGFWRRFGAYWIDILVLLPLTGIVYFGSDKFRLFYLYWSVPSLIIGLIFHVYLVKRFGGTPGKLAVGTRIALVDGSPISLKAAAVRYSVLFVLSVLSTIAVAMSTLAISDDVYFSLSYVERSRKLIEMAPPWYFAVSVLAQIWVWGEFITMLFNKKRRAVHDFLAGTVVVLTTRT